MDIFEIIKDLIETDAADEEGENFVPHVIGMNGAKPFIGLKLVPPVGTIGVDLIYPCPCGKENLNLVRGFDPSLTAEEAGAKFSEFWRVAHDEMNRHEEEAARKES